MLDRPVEDEDVFQAIELTYLVVKTGCLPQAGGIYDQDMNVIRMLKAGFFAHDELERRNNKVK